MKKIPTRRRIPLITDLLELREMTTDPLGYCQRMVRTYGDVCYVPLPGVRNYMIHDPDILKEMLVTQASKFKKSRLYQAMQKFLGLGLLTSDGSYHLGHRRLIAPAFHKQRVSEYAQTMVDCTTEEIAKWKNGDEISINKTMANITLRVITKTMFASQMEAEELTRISSLVSEMIEVAARVFQNPFYLLCYERDIMIPVVRRTHRLAAKVDEVINAIIASYREKEKSEGTDLLTMLMEARDEESGETLNDKQVRDEIVTMFLAGHETTSTALSWTWYLLGTHPEVAQQFYDEVENVIGTRPPCADHYPLLKLTANIFRETLRLYPPAWTFAREPIEDIEIKGYHFPKGSVLCTIVYIMHHSPLYFHQPEEFLPQRWDEPSIKDLPRFVYFPFGGGNRMCIGEGFAWMEAVMILSTIASRFRLHLPDGFRTGVNALFTLRTKEELKMKAELLTTVDVSVVS